MSDSRGIKSMKGRASPKWAYDSFRKDALMYTYSFRKDTIMS